MDTVPAEYDDRVDGPLVHYFLLTIDIVVDGKTDFSVVDTVFILADILNAKKTGTKCLYKFKVTAEPKLIAVFEVENITCLEVISAQLMRHGHSKVTCDPLIEVEYSGRRMGVDSALTGKSPRNLKKPFAMFCHVEQEHHGITTDKFIQIQKEEVEFLLQYRKQGLELELFRVAGKRTVYGFVGETGESFDDIISCLPVTRQNGQNTNISPKFIQRLDDYVQEMRNVFY